LYAFGAIGAVVTINSSFSAMPVPFFLAYTRTCVVGTRAFNQYCCFPHGPTAASNTHTIYAAFMVWAAVAIATELVWFAASAIATLVIRVAAIRRICI